MEIKKRILTITLIVLSLSTLLAFSGCTSSPESSKPTIVTSLSLVGDITSEIVGSQFEVKSIVEGLEDPHTYEPLPSEVETLTDADLFIRLGVPGLEPWVPNILDANPSLEVLTLVNWDEHEYMKIDPLTGSYNGHVWLSPLNIQDMVDKIYDHLATTDNAHQGLYENNTQQYQAELDQLMTKINTSRDEVLGSTKVVINHPAFMYLLDLLDMERIAIIEEQHGSEPSAEHIESIIETMNTENVSLVIVQPQVDSTNLDTILDETGATSVALTPLLGVSGVNSYIDMIEFNLEALETAVTQ